MGRPRVCVQGDCWVVIGLLMMGCRDLGGMVGNGGGGTP